MRILKTFTIFIVFFLIFGLNSALAIHNPFDYYVKYLNTVKEAKHLRDLKPFLSSNPVNAKEFERIFSDEKKAADTLKNIKYHAIYPDKIESFREELGKSNANLYITGNSQSGHHTIRVRMVKESDAWRLFSEDWNWGKKTKSKPKPNTSDEIKDKIEKFLKQIPPDIKKKIPDEIFRIKKYLPFILISTLALIIFFAVISNRKAQAERVKMLKSFSLKHGMEYSKEDRMDLGQKIVDSGVLKTYQMKTAKAMHVLSQSDWDSKLYLFSCTMGQQKSKINYTACLFELSKDLNVKIQIRKKLFGFLEKMIMAMLGSNLTEVKIDVQGGFKKDFIVYSDNPDLARKFVNTDVAEHIISNKKKIITSGTLITLS